jgi:hypothetical protein
MECTAWPLPGVRYLGHALGGQWRGHCSQVREELGMEIRSLMG